MDGGSKTCRMDSADNAIKCHQGRASGLFYAPRLIPRLTLDVAAILSSTTALERSNLIES